MRLSIRFAAFILAALALALPAAAQDEAQIFNAFAYIGANGTVVKSADKQLQVVAALAGPFFIETDEGPVESGLVVCAASMKIDQETAGTSGSGACTFSAQDGATAWGDWQCEGYELVGCRGILKLTGGTARMAGVTGEGAMIWRPNVQSLKKQLEGINLQNVTGLILWRDFKLTQKK